MTQEGEKLATDLVDSEEEAMGVSASQEDGSVKGQKIAGVSRADRQASYDLADFPELTGREEDFRFTPLKRLKGLHSDALTGPAPAVSVSGSDRVRVETVGRDDARVGSAGIPEDRLAANAWAHFQEATVVTVPQEVELEDTVLVDIQGSSSDPAASHIIVEAQAFSKARIVLRHRGSAVVSQNVEFAIADSANVTVVSLQEWDDEGSVHASAQHVSLGRDSSFKHVVVSLGGETVRVTPSVRFRAPGADVEMFGLTFVDDGQHLESRLFVDHSQPSCRSRVTYKSALQGEGAHGVWVGDVLIRPAAEATDTYELNRNLILNDGPRMDSIPNLEIETGVIAGAGHASTTGQLDAEHLYYLMSRGIPEREARALVVRGFLFEILQQIEDEGIEERLREVVETELANVEQGA
ncbi:Fe-S cluster assembly protein SufD [Kocuria palustris]|uniref:Fe-S cluster assembly protein SufD n=1 Tax=Kocuria palustris TaxID=71999 RepID=UPI0011A88C58|nr:Fe-S cluster assembly protein SufD [Kocuria palustris]